MYQPTLARLGRLSEQGNLVPVWRELPADLETPVSVYLKLQDEGPSFLLESIAGGEQVARYSFIGVRPRALVTVAGDRVMERANGRERTTRLPAGGDALAALKAMLADSRPVRVPGLPRFIGGLVGFLGYDAVRRFERLPATAVDDLGLPDAAFMLADTLVAFDHARQRLLVIANAWLEATSRPPTNVPRRASTRLWRGCARQLRRLRLPSPSRLRKSQSIRTSPSLSSSPPCARPRST